MTMRTMKTNFLVALSGLVLSGCVSSPPGSDGVAAEAYIPRDIATVAASCAKSNFEPAATRQLLLAQGFVEQQRPLLHQLEKFPTGAKGLTQGVTTPWAHPCRPSADARYISASLRAAARALVAEGFTTSDGLFFVRGPQEIRLQARGSALGGPAEIKIEPF